MVDLINLCSTYSATGVDTPILRQIREAGGIKLGSAQGTLPDGARTSSPTSQSRRKWTRLSAEARAVVVARYSAGDTSTVLAKEYGVAKSTILGILRDSSVVVRRQPLNKEHVSEPSGFFLGSAGWRHLRAERASWFLTSFLGTVRMAV